MGSFDPTGLFKWGRSWYATDSGANDLLKSRKGKVSLVKIFRDEPVTGGKAQAVPTETAVGVGRPWTTHQERPEEVRVCQPGRESHGGLDEAESFIRCASGECPLEQ